jgi:uncharacterized membrane protein YtjA (UPF0391 family)
LHGARLNGRPAFVNGTGWLAAHSKFRTDFQEAEMLKWAVIFAIVALVAGALGFGGVAGAAAGIAKFLFVLFLVVCAVFLVLGVTAARKIGGG